ncbi:MAG: acylphosphatase [Bacteroidetes bacterium]|nr:MAG: acylphosphatase [Bacteroidota bacterium]
MNDIQAEIIQVYGKVQGVFYRKSTLIEAKKLGLCGWVKNREDGSVQIFAEGSARQLEDLKRWCKKGPAQADVQELISESAPAQFYKSFEIEYSH